MTLTESQHFTNWSQFFKLKIGRNKCWVHISTTWLFKFDKMGATLEYRIIELTPSSKNSILEKPLVANLGVFHISHKCQGLENSTLFTKKNSLNL